jgi:hypothetical protein
MSSAISGPMFFRAMPVHRAIVDRLGHARPSLSA